MKKSIRIFIMMLVLCAGIIPVQRMMVNAEVLNESISIIAEDVKVNQFDESFDLLNEVSAVDQNGLAVEVTVKDDGGFDIANINDYTVVYEAIDPVNGEAITKERIVSVQEALISAEEEQTQNVVPTAMKAMPRASQTVNTVADLEAAVNTAAEGDVITLGAGFPSGITTLVMPSVNVTIDGNGNSWNTGKITINGNGSGSITVKNLKIDGSTSTDSLMYISNTNGAVVLDNMEIRNAQKGAIHIATPSAAKTTINNTIIADGVSQNKASAIHLEANVNLDLNASTVENNVGNGGGYPAAAISTKNYAGTLNINNVIFKNNKNNVLNTGVYGGGGGAIAILYMQAGTMNINESYFYGNETSGTDSSAASTYDGGAINVFDGRDGSVINIDKTTFDSNLAHDDGGAIMLQGTGSPGLTTVISNSTFYNNVAQGLSGGNRSGGAIQFFKNGGSSSMKNTVIGSTFVGNVAGNENTIIEQRGGAIGLSGAGIFATASLTHSNSLYFGNQVYGSNGQLNLASNYKDASNTSATVLTGNLIGADRGSLATPHTEAEIFGAYGVSLTTNYSSIKAGADGMIIPTIAIKPEGLAENKSASEVSGTDQRTFTKFKDIGAVESTFVKYDANGGDFTLAPMSTYDGTKYYELDASNKTTEYYDVGYIGLGGTIKSGSDLSVARDSYIFLGWSTDPAATTADAAYGAGQAVTHVKDNVTLYAVWGLPEKYEVTYNANTGTGAVPVDANEYESGDVVTVLDQGVLEKDGFEFIGWNTAADGSGTSYAANATFNITQDTTLYAQWSELYTVTFDSQGGSSIDPQTGMRVGDSIVEPTDPTREGYTFGGWYNEDTCTSAWDFANDTISGHKTLYAKWIKDADPVVPVEPVDPIKPSPEKPMIKPDTSKPVTGDVTNTNALFALIGLSGAAIFIALAKKYKFNK